MVWNGIKESFLDNLSTLTEGQVKAAWEVEMALEQAQVSGWSTVASVGLGNTRFGKWRLGVGGKGRALSRLLRHECMLQSSHSLHRNWLLPPADLL